MTKRLAAARSMLSDMAEILMAVQSDCHIGLVRDFDGPLDLDAQRATPLALLCYDVILNALKHAWPNRRRGRLVLRTAGGNPEIRVTDDGVGLVDSEVTKGLGSRLTRALANEAKVEVITVSRANDGATVTLRLA